MRKRKVIVTSSSELESDLIEFDVSDSQLPIKRIRVVNNQCLVDKYAPDSSLLLAVHKKKVDQVRNWLQINRSAPAILILTGPVGSAKTTELQIKVQEYENGVNTNIFNSIEGESEYLPIGQQFHDFIQSCIESDGLRYDLNDSDHPTRKVGLIEDMPVVSSSSTQLAIHTALRHYNSSKSSTPIVIILSDTLYSANDRGTTKRNFIPLDVLPICSEIIFNPVAKTYLLKALNRVNELESGNQGFHKVSKASIEDILNACNGDIRSAMNELQFASLKKKSQETVHRVNDLSLFRVVGEAIVPDVYLSDKNLKYARKELTYNPEHDFESIQVEAGIFNLFLNQNCSRHAQTIEEMASLSEYHSKADLLLGSWDQSKTLSRYAASVAIRGTLISWDPLLLPKKRTFLSLVKSENWASELKQKNSFALWKDDILLNSINSFLIGDSSNGIQTLQFSHNFGKCATFCDLIPYLGILKRRSRNLDVLPMYQRQFLTAMTDYHSSARERHFGEKEDYEESQTKDASLQLHPIPSQSNSARFLNELKREKHLSLSDDEIE